MERTTATQTTAPVGIVPPGQGLSLADGDVQAMVKASAGSTLGAFTVLECTLPPGAAGQPPHLHRQTLEVVYGLEGQLHLQMGERTVEAGPGSVAFVPKGVAHALSNPSATVARFLWVFSPGGMEAYLQEAAKLAASHGTPMPAEAARRLGEQYDVEPA